MSDPLVDYLAQYTEKAFDPNAHPRGGKGTATGGKFVPKSGEGTPPPGKVSPGQPVANLGQEYAKYLYTRIGQHPTIGGFRSAVVKPLEHEANLQHGLQRSREDNQQAQGRLQATLAKAPAHYQPTGRRARVEQLRQMIASLGLTSTTKEAEQLAQTMLDQQTIIHGGFYDFVIGDGQSEKGIFDLHRPATAVPKPSPFALHRPAADGQDDAKHPHQPAGSATGGQFAPTHQGGMPLGGRFPVQMGGGYQVNSAVPAAALIPQTRQTASTFHPGAQFYPVYHARSQQHAGYVSKSATGVHGWDYLGQHMGVYPSMDEATQSVIKTHALKPKAKPLYTAKAIDASKHPRGDKGSSSGGQ